MGLAEREGFAPPEVGSMDDDNMRGGPVRRFLNDRDYDRVVSLQLTVIETDRTVTQGQHQPSPAVVSRCS
jgi:hypothetical protein